MPSRGAVAAGPYRLLLFWLKAVPYAGNVHKIASYRVRCWWFVLDVPWMQAHGQLVALLDRGKLCSWPADGAPPSPDASQGAPRELVVPSGAARVIFIEDVGNGRLAAVSEAALSRSHLASLHIFDVASSRLLDTASALDPLSSTLLQCASPWPGVLALGTDCGLRFWREGDRAAGKWGLVGRTSFSTVGGEVPSNHHLHEALRGTTAEYVCALTVVALPGSPRRTALACGSGDGTVSLVFPSAPGAWDAVRGWSARSGADALFRRVRVGKCHDRVCAVADLGLGRFLTADLTNCFRVFSCGSGPTPGAPGSGPGAPALLRVLSLDVHRHGSDNDLENGVVSASGDGRLAIGVGDKCELQLWRWDAAAGNLKADRAAPAGQVATAVFVATSARGPDDGGDEGAPACSSGSTSGGQHGPAADWDVAAARRRGLTVFVGGETGSVERWEIGPNGQIGLLTKMFRPSAPSGPVFSVVLVRPGYMFSETLLREQFVLRSACSRAVYAEVVLTPKGATAFFCARRWGVATTKHRGRRLGRRAAAGQPASEAPPRRSLPRHPARHRRLRWTLSKRKASSLRQRSNSALRPRQLLPRQRRRASSSRARVFCLQRAGGKLLPLRRR